MIDQRYFINKFPKLELFYDSILHRKVQTDLYLLIPNGVKVFAWFTFYKEQNICVIVHQNKYKIITKIEETHLCFDKSLSYGTIISGTYFNYNNMRFITCEDIYYYKGDYIYEKIYMEKINIIKKLFENELQQKAYTKNFTIIGPPVISNNLKIAFSKINLLPYPVKGILFRNLKCVDAAGLILNNRQPIKECIFKVKAEISQDIYNLYCKNHRTNTDSEFYGLACISDYKTSVMMNKHFRKIKENANLDLLEMSDDEEEFESVNEDKFVNLKKILYMKCIYMKKFRKWKPIEVVNFGDKLLTKREIQQEER
jgi:hypothetical protein